MLVEGVDERARLAVCERDDDVRAGMYVRQNGLGRGRSNSHHDRPFCPRGCVLAEAGGAGALRDEGRAYRVAS